MKLLHFTWSCLLFLALVDAHKILVWPAEWSHWINMKVKIKFYKLIVHHVMILCSDHHRGVACAKSHDSRDAIVGVHGFSERRLQEGHLHPVRVKLSM